MRRMVIHARYHRGAGVQDSGANLPHNGAITQDGQRETVSGGASAGAPRRVDSGRTASPATATMAIRLLRGRASIAAAPDERRIR